MTTVIKQLTKEEAQEFLEASKVVNRMPPDILKKLTDNGWYVVEDYSIEYKHETRGLYVVIEFCIGDFCVYPCSKNNHWLLEKKQSFTDFIGAFVAASVLLARMEAGDTWQGEND